MIHLLHYLSSFLFTTFWIHSASFFRSLRRKNLIALGNWIFHSPWFLRSFIMWLMSNLIKILFSWWCFVFISISFIFDVIASKSKTSSYWFIIIPIIWFKYGSYISNFFFSLLIFFSYVFDSFIFFYWFWFTKRFYVFKYLIGIRVFFSYVSDSFVFFYLFWC